MQSILRSSFNPYAKNLVGGTKTRLTSTAQDNAISYVIMNNSTVRTVYLLGSSAGTSTSGFPLLAQGVYTADMTRGVTIWGVTTGSTATTSNVRIVKGI